VPPIVMTSWDEWWECGSERKPGPHATRAAGHGTPGASGSVIEVNLRRPGTEINAQPIRSSSEEGRDRNFNRPDGLTASLGTMSVSPMDGVHSVIGTRRQETNE